MPLCAVPPEDLPDHDIHMDICWKRVTNYVCSQPLHGRRTTYTECCCQDGEAWSQQCALCPPRSSGEKGDPCLPGGEGPQGRKCPHLGRRDLGVEQSECGHLPSLLSGDRVGEGLG